MLNIDNSRPFSQADLANASESNVIGAPVQAGEEVSFRVVMKAPRRLGSAISYWRLKTADGIPFGHRLWCDIQIIAAPTPAPARAAEAPSSLPMYEALLQARVEKMGKNQAICQSQAQQLEQQRAERVRSVRTAAAERLLEKRRSVQAAALSLKSAPLPKPKEDSYKESAAELPVEEKPAERQPAPQASGMIFPQLDKESPESSTYETSTVQPESPVSEKSTIARTVTVASDEEFFEDAESVALQSDDDSFMTDEEYDILDASDEETQ